MPKKKFIDKNNSVTFHLVHRSQHDPLAASNEAPQRVLVPAPSKKSKKQSEEEQKFGIFYDDDYNYLQHLKEVDRTVVWVPTETPKESKEPKEKPKEEERKKINLPSSVFASNVEEKVGLLNKAAPQGLRLDLDPDVIAALDEDFDFEDPNNELEDNFMELANVEKSDDDDDDESDNEMSSNFDDEEMDEVGSLDGPQYTFRDEETKSRFTDYSMSSSVIRRNDQLTLLDNRFEKLYEAYDENEIGALDCDEIEGHIPANSDLLLQCAREFERQQGREILEQENLKAHLKKYAENGAESSDEELVDMEVKPTEKWDCESILSTYSNIYNHPKLITEPRSNKIKVNARTGIPQIETQRLTAKLLAHLDNSDSNLNVNSNGQRGSVAGQSVISNLSALSIRPKGETSEERKERKKQLKDYRKERRIERKANTIAFKEEAKRQVKIEINKKNNVQGNRIL